MPQWRMAWIGEFSMPHAHLPRQALWMRDRWERKWAAETVVPEYDVPLDARWFHLDQAVPSAQERRRDNSHKRQFRDYRPDNSRRRKSLRSHREPPRKY